MVVSQGCVLCSIATGGEVASFVYDNGGVIGLMSLDQPTSHKIIVAPRSHRATIYDLSDEEASSVFVAAVHIARAVRDVTGCAGLNVVQSNGEAGGQELQHFHLHLIPRNEGDDVILNWPSLEPERHHLAQMAHEIRAAMKVS